MARISHRRWALSIAVLGTAALVVSACGNPPQTGPSVSPPSTLATGSSLPAPPLPGSGIVPNLAGLTGAQAQLSVAQAKIDGVEVTAEVVRKKAVPGTVVAQKPRAGTMSSDVSLTMAVPPSTSCSNDQVEMTFLGGGPTTGNVFGTLVVRNVSAQWCTLTGPLQVSGRDSAGQVVTQIVNYTVPTPIVLSPQSPPPTDGSSPPLGDVQARISISAEYRDDPRSPDGLCTTGRVVPATWAVVLPTTVTLSAVNDDPKDGYTQFQRFPTCRGEMEAPSPVQLSPTSEP
jgi:hypothetical protein